MTATMRDLETTRDSVVEYLKTLDAIEHPTRADMQEQARYLTMLGTIQAQMILLQTARNLTEWS